VFNKNAQIINFIGMKKRKFNFIGTKNTFLNEN